MCFDQMGIDILKSFIFNLKIHFNLMLWVNIITQGWHNSVLARSRIQGGTSNTISSKLFILFLLFKKSGFTWLDFCFDLQ